MPNRFWVGGNAFWDGTAGTKWSDTSGGAGGFSVPTTADDVFFDAASGTVTCTIQVGNTGAKSINFTGYTGTLTYSAAITISGSLTYSAAMTVSGGGQITFNGTGTITSVGKTFVGGVVIDGSGITVNLGDAFFSASQLSINQGTFTTNNFSITCAQLTSISGITRTINLGSSIVSVFGNAGVGLDATNLTFNAGTSQINLSAPATPSISAVLGGVNFYNVAFITANWTSNGLYDNAGGSANNLTFAGRTSTGLNSLVIGGNTTINGTLTISPGTDATMRTFFRSNNPGTTRTLTCAAFSGTDADFRDIAIAGAAAPISGTRFGDCKGNSGITFPAPKTVYWNLAGGGNWSATGWAATSGGTPVVSNFPLAQDTAVFEVTGLNSGATVTINANWNIGAVDMSARTSNTMTLATGTTACFVYGNWINGTGTTLSGTQTISFAGRGSQTITSAGVIFTQTPLTNSPGGTVTLLDALVVSRNNIGAISVSAGTFDANNYNVTLTGASAGVSSSTISPRAINIGSGTWTIPGGNAWTVNNTNLTITGTGVLNFTSASGKNFVGAGIQTYPTINQGGTGTLTIFGSNRFANITNTAIGRVQFIAGDINVFITFNLSGTAGNLLPLGSSSAAQTTLQKPTAWLMGANSTDAGNNTGLSFTAGGGIDYLSVSYINGTVVSPTFDAFIIERITAVDTPSASAVFPGALSENVAAIDASSAAYLWNLVDDSQASNWQNVSNSQASGWGLIDDSQAGGSWTPVTTNE